ncbi:MAG: glycosyltransferase family 2 protein [Candidatus Jordarchaeaceae archaeon]
MEAHVKTGHRIEGGIRLRGIFKKSNPKKPLITIVTVTYNAKEFLERSIRSVLEQSYDNVEYIVVDGGSTDGTLDIIKRYDDYIDYWVSEKDRGIYDAMNKGTRVASGDWIYFLGADDVLVNCLHLIAPYLRNTRSIYYGDVYLPGKNKVYGGEFKFHTLISKNINHQSIFYPKEVFKKYNYNLKYRLLADYELNIRCWGDKTFRFKYLPVLVCIHNDSGYSFRSLDPEFENDKPTLIFENFSKQIFIRNAYLNATTRVKKILNILGIEKPLRNLIICKKR